VGKYTYAKQWEYFQFPGRFVVCTVGTASAVTGCVEYNEIRFGPPHAWLQFKLSYITYKGRGETNLEFPLQAILQVLSEAMTAPSTSSLPQTVNND
jgi:hypothetical protein